jgi:hypothetical protein
MALFYKSAHRKTRGAKTQWIKPRSSNYEACPNGRARVKARLEMRPSPESENTLNRTGAPGRLTSSWNGTTRVTWNVM